MPTKLVAAVVLAAASIAAIGTAAAEDSKTVSVTLTCEDLLALIKVKDTQTAGVAILWLDGVYSAKADKTEIPAGWAQTLGQGVGGNCAITANAKRTVLEIVGEVHDKFAK